MSAEAIARALGGTQSHKGWWNCRCPVCQGDGKLGLKDGRKGLAVSCFKGCSRADILTEIKRLGVSATQSADKPAAPDPKELAHQAAGEEAYRRAQIAKAQWIWDKDTVAVDDNGPVPLLTYLGSRRVLIETPNVIRFRYGNVKSKRSPAMVARIDHAVTGPMAIHITFLRPGGEGKAACEKPRIIVGPWNGGAVQLAEPRPDTWLIVAEGIETTLSMMQACCLPGWAALCEGGIERLVLPPSVRKVIICADNDKSGVGQRAAARAEQRWTREGRLVKIATPPMPDSDWNDVLMGRAPARTERGRTHA